jgi:MFS family permease
MLVFTRGLVGVGEASFGTLAPAYLADVLPLQQRSRALGFFYLALPMGSALAYLAGGFIGGRWGWQAAFLLGGLPGLVLAVTLKYLNDHAVAAPLSPATGIPARGNSDPVSDPIPGPRDVDLSPRFLAATRELWRIPTLRRVTLGYGMITFTLGGLAFWMPRYLEVAKGLSLAQANYLLFGTVTLAGGLGTFIGGILGERLMRYTPRAPLWVSGLGVVLAIPLAALTIFAAPPTWYIPALVGAIFLLFLNPGIITAVIVSVAGPARRARAVALNIVVIHLVGDVPSPFLIGWLSDLFGLTCGVSITLVALGLGAALLLAGLPYLAPDLIKAGEDLQIKDYRGF